MTAAIADATAFIHANTRLRPVPLVPEISLHVADEALPLWHQTEEQLGEAGLPPPFWAFAWAGGQALARYVLDHPDCVAGRQVIDLASGSGLVAIAAMKAGARRVTAFDIDGFAREAIAVNAAANGVSIDVSGDDLLAAPHPLPARTVLAGDIFYQQDIAGLAFTFLQSRADQGAHVLIGDPGRYYLPKERLAQLATYGVPVTRELEDAEVKHTGVWTLK